MYNSCYLSQCNRSELARRYPIKRINSIPELSTISVATTGSIVTYQLCPWRFKQLCNEGIMLLKIAQTPSAGDGSSAFTVSLQVLANPLEGSTGTPVTTNIGTDLTSDKVVNGNRLLIYFNKADGIFQTLS